VTRRRRGRSHSCEGDGGVEPLDHRRVAVARQHRPQVGEPEPAVHLGVPAAHHVELERLRVVAQHVEFERVVVGPPLDGALQFGEPVAAERRGGGAPALPGQFLDDVGGNLAGAVGPNLGGERRDQRGDHAGLDLAPAEERKGVGHVGSSGNRSNSLSGFCDV
jgi:hypothetical protein